MSLESYLLAKITLPVLLLHLLSSLVFGRYSTAEQSHSPATRRRTAQVGEKSQCRIKAAARNSSGLTRQGTAGNITDRS